MSNFYSSMQATAARLLADKGQVMSCVNTPGPSYDPDTSVATPGAPVTKLVMGIMTTGAQKNRSDTSQRAADNVLLLSPVAIDGSDYIPQLDDVIAFGGVPHRVISVGGESPSGVNLLWELEVVSGV